jgi:prepilin-type N-terminal cleavage/methylation domain-containing protein
MKKGFTFVELLVVVTIIMVLSAVGLVSYRQTNASARDARPKADLESIRSALELCRAESGEYPDDISGTIVCETITYLNPVPNDPRSGVAGFEYNYTKTGVTEYTLCAETMEGANEVSPYCVTNP